MVPKDAKCSEMYVETIFRLFFKLNLKKNWSKQKWSYWDFEIFSTKSFNKKLSFALISYLHTFQKFLRKLFYKIEGIFSLGICCNVWKNLIKIGAKFFSLSIASFNGHWPFFFFIPSGLRNPPPPPVSHHLRKVWTPSRPPESHPRTRPGSHRRCHCCCCRESIFFKIYFIYFIFFKICFIYFLSSFCLQ